MLDTGLLKVRILAFSTTFTQLTARIKNFLVSWLLFLGLKEGLVECAIVCVKSWVILEGKSMLCRPLRLPTMYDGDQKLKPRSSEKKIE